MSNEQNNLDFSALPYWMKLAGMAVAVIVLASGWALFRALRRPIADNAPALPVQELPAVVQPAAEALPPPVAAPSELLQEPAPVASAAAAAEEIVTDPEILRQREEAGRAVAAKLREEARKNPAAAVPEAKLKAIERGEDFIQ